MEDKILARGEVDYLSGPEVQFWTDLIEKYLHPLDADSAKQVRNGAMSISQMLWFGKYS